MNEHTHKYEIARIGMEPISPDSLAMREIAYVVCAICGDVKKKEV